MSSEIFVVVGSSGEYDDYSQWEEVATFDHAKALEFIEHKKAEWKLYESRCEQVEAFKAQWSASNPAPGGGKMKDVPRWPGGLGKHQITDEMRREHDAILEYNSVINREYDARRNAAVREFIVDTLGVNDKEDIEELSCSFVWLEEKPSYQIKTIKVI